MKNTRFYKAVEDFYRGILAWRIWCLLGWQDIRLRYRRSYLGPLWITISMIINIYSMGFLYGHLFKMNVQEYLPNLAAGLLTWTFLATVITESTSAFFMEGNTYLKQIQLPFTICTMRVMTKNLIIFLHNIIAFLTVVIYAHVPINANTLLVIPNLLILIVSGIAFSMVISIVGTRFRDVNPIIVSLVQVLFFLTPVIWSSRLLPPQYHFVMDWNPLAQYIALIREPLLGRTPSLHAYEVTTGCAVLGLILMLSLLTRVRHKIIYWL